MGNAACGGDESENAALGAAAAGDRSDALSWAIADRPRALDPLYATGSDDRLAARQLFEPLAENLGGPYDFPRRSPGLALSIDPSPDATVWRARLRPGVRFQDGTPFNAAAVLANVARWQASARGRAAIGTLLVDAPRPDLVRFILPAPDPEFDRRLESPALGIVAPAAIRGASGGPMDADEVAQAGTGPFELRDSGAAGVMLARNTQWWGADRGLGAGVDQIALRVVTNPGERLELLRAGTVQVADLAPSQLRVVGSDPLLTDIRRGAEPLGAERSVRGIPADDPVPSLNAVWITGIDAG